MGAGPSTFPKVTWTVASTTETTVGSVPVINKQLVGRVDNAAYPTLDVTILATPERAEGCGRAHARDSRVRRRRCAA